jgi:hypothetical protein
MFDLDLSRFLLAFYLATMASYVFGLVAHEFGHAGMGWLVDLPPRLIRIGTGPVLLRRKLGSAWLDLRLWPLYGFVTRRPRPAGRNLAYAACVLGGPFANVTLLAAMVLLWSTSDDFDDRMFWALALGSAQLALVLTSCIPFVFKRHGTKHSSDMFKVIRLIRRPAAGTLEEWHAALMRSIAPVGMEIPPLSRDTPEIIYQVTRGDRLTDSWGRRDTSMALQSILAQGRLPALERALVLDSLVLIERGKGKGASVELMDAWSREAVALANGPYTQVTRGGALVALGQPAEALALLIPLVEAASAIGRGPLCQAYIRHAEAKQRLHNSINESTVKISY